MSLAPLATVADIEARGVTVDASELDAVNTYLDVASAIVRDAAGSPISETESTLTLAPRVGRVWLPGRPVTAVSAVSEDGVSVDTWRLVDDALTRPCGFWHDVTVTYTHGLPTVPADIVDLVCRMAGRALVQYRNSPDSALASKPVVSERIGDYSVTYAYEITYSDMELPRYLRQRLAARFGSSVVAVRAL